MVSLSHFLLNFSLIIKHSVILELQEKLQCIECVKKISTKFIKELMRLTAVWPFHRFTVQCVNVTLVNKSVHLMHKTMAKHNTMETKHNTMETKHSTMGTRYSERGLYSGFLQLNHSTEFGFPMNYVLRFSMSDTRLYVTLH